MTCGAFDQAYEVKGFRKCGHGEGKQNWSLDDGREQKLHFECFLDLRRSVDMSAVGRKEGGDK